MNINLSPLEESFVYYCSADILSEENLLSFYNMMLRVVPMSMDLELGPRRVVREAEEIFESKDRLFRFTLGNPTKEKICKILSDYFQTHQEYFFSVPLNLLPSKREEFLSIIREKAFDFFLQFFTILVIRSVDPIQVIDLGTGKSRFFHYDRMTNTFYVTDPQENIESNFEKDEWIEFLSKFFSTNKVIRMIPFINLLESIPEEFHSFAFLERLLQDIDFRRDIYSLL